MPAARKPAPAPARRSDSAEGRAQRDHAAIARLADDLLPALIAKLAASGLGEIELRQGEWKARLRKPAGAGGAPPAPASGEAHDALGRVAGSGAPAHADRSGGERPPSARTVADEQEESRRPAATSPAVGVYHPCKELAVGMRVKAGDRIGTVDVLGVHQDVVAPVDGVVGSSLAEAGEAVEYGQELVRIELPEIGPSAGEAVAVMGEA